MRTGLPWRSAHLDHGGELLVALRAPADVAGIDAVLGERRARNPGTASAACGRCSGSRRPAARAQPSASSRSRMRGTCAAASGVFTVMRTSSEPARASASTCRAVACSVRGVGVGHRLHDDGRTAADQHVADPHRARSFFSSQSSLEREPRDFYASVRLQIDRAIVVSDASVLRIADDDLERRQAPDHALGARRIERGHELALQARPSPRSSTPRSKRTTMRCTPAATGFAGATRCSSAGAACATFAFALAVGAGVLGAEGGGVGAGAAREGSSGALAAATKASWRLAFLSWCHS